MSNYLLTLVINFGSPFIALVIFLGALGFPVGASVLVIAAGAFAEQGIIGWHTTVLLGLLGAVLGDILSFGLGYYNRDWVDRRFGRSPIWNNARNTFDKRAGLAIYLTRFLVTSLAIPTNLIAGGSGIRFRRFLTWDILGEITWLALYGGLGFWFGSQWEVISNFISNFGGLSLGLFLFGIGIWAGVRRMKMIEIRKQQKVSEE
jgi:membrane-associated protein